jgi:cell pole-organizing protein PopZ
MNQTALSPSQETTVEEALDSIRKVIRLNLETGLEPTSSLEEPCFSEALRGSSGGEQQPVNDILVLTEYLQEDGSIQSFKDRITEQHMSPEPQDEQPLQLSEELNAEEQASQTDPSDANEAVVNKAAATEMMDASVESPSKQEEALEDQQAPEMQGTEDLISDKTMAESAAAFSELASVARAATTLQSQSKSASVSPQTAGTYTVDALMRELLRPMLKEWLDAHLPSLVKWLVTEQIEKMLQAQQSPQQGKATKAAMEKAPEKA